MKKLILFLLFVAFLILLCIGTTELFDLILNLIMKVAEFMTYFK